MVRFLTFAQIFLACAWFFASCGRNFFFNYTPEGRRVKPPLEPVVERMGEIGSAPEGRHWDFYIDDVERPHIAYYKYISFEEDETKREPTKGLWYATLDELSRWRKEKVAVRDRTEGLYPNIFPVTQLPTIVFVRVSTDITADIDTWDAEWDIVEAVRHDIYWYCRVVTRVGSPVVSLRAGYSREMKKAYAVFFDASAGAVKIIRWTPLALELESEKLERCDSQNIVFADDVEGEYVYLLGDGELRVRALVEPRCNAISYSQLRGGVEISFVPQFCRVPDGGVCGGYKTGFAFYDSANAELVWVEGDVSMPSRATEFSLSLLEYLRRWDLRKIDVVTGQGCNRIFEYGVLSVKLPYPPKITDVTRSSVKAEINLPFLGRFEFESIYGKRKLREVFLPCDRGLSEFFLAFNSNITEYADRELADVLEEGKSELFDMLYEFSVDEVFVDPDSGRKISFDDNELRRVLSEVTDTFVDSTTTAGYLFALGCEEFPPAVRVVREIFQVFGTFEPEEDRICTGLIDFAISNPELLPPTFSEIYSDRYLNAYFESATQYFLFVQKTFFDAGVFDLARLDEIQDMTSRMMALWYLCGVIKAFLNVMSQPKLKFSYDTSAFDTVVSLGKRKVMPYVYADGEGNLHFAYFNDTPPSYSVGYTLLFENEEGYLSAITHIVDGGGGGYYTKGGGGPAVVATDTGLPIVVYFDQATNDMKVALLLGNTWYSSARATIGTAGIRPVVRLNLDQSTLLVLFLVIERETFNLMYFYIPILVE